MISRRVMSMEKILEQTLLYDFYGELLTDHQKQVYEDVVLNDYSLSEVAEERRISRQGVHDLVKRCNRILQDYESKLHLVEKFVAIKEQVERMEASLQGTEQPDREELVRQLNQEHPGAKQRMFTAILNGNIKGWPERIIHTR